jgi:hypothetical protein
MFWHFDPSCVLSCDGRRVSAWSDDVERACMLVSGGHLEIGYCDSFEGLGWHAPVYGTLVPAWIAAVTREAAAPFSTITWIGERSPNGHMSLQRVAAECEPGGTIVAAQLTADDVDSLLLVRPGEAAASQVRSSETVDFHTDARIFHCAQQPGRRFDVSVIDATRVLSLRDERLSIVGETLIPDLHLTIENDTIDLRALEPAPRIQLLGTAVAHVGHIRLNGRTLSVRATRCETLEIHGGDWREPCVELALSAS